ncbi:MAG: MGMT family protein [Patescibacteria group bacterium]|jgi:methylated-DNA-protein-cysteine methyltransferase-like protein
MPHGTYQHIYAVCRKIPRGRVASYGQIAALAGMPRGARLVGWALHAVDDTILHTMPWWRVINAKGYISTTCPEHNANEQKILLEKDGVEVTERDGNFFVDMKQYQWKSRMTITKH